MIISVGFLLVHQIWELVFEQVRWWKFHNFRPAQTLRTFVRRWVFKLVVQKVKNTIRKYVIWNIQILKYHFRCWFCIYWWNMGYFKCWSSWQIGSSIGQHFHWRCCTNSQVGASAWKWWRYWSRYCSCRITSKILTLVQIIYFLLENVVSYLQNFPKTVGPQKITLYGVFSFIFDICCLVNNFSNNIGNNIIFNTKNLFSNNIICIFNNEKCAF